MKIGIAFANTGPFGTAEGVVTLGREAEAAGFESVWTIGMNEIVSSAARHR